jgi:hypothetical protein
MTKFRITWVQVMALIALFGILLGVIGTAFLYDMNPTVTPTVNLNASGEVIQ